MSAKIWKERRAHVRIRSQEALYASGLLWFPVVHVRQRRIKGDPDFKGRLGLYRFERLLRGYTDWQVAAVVIRYHL